MRVQHAAVAQERSSLCMQEGLAPEVLQQGKGLLGSLHSAHKLLMPQQADGAAHSGVHQLQAAFCVQIA